jgi:hypothetical protein
MRYAVIIPHIVNRASEVLQRRDSRSRRLRPRVNGVQEPVNRVVAGSPPAV